MTQKKSSLSISCLGWTQEVRFYPSLWSFLECKNDRPKGYCAGDMRLGIMPDDETNGLDSNGCRSRRVLLTDNPSAPQSRLSYRKSLFCFMRSKTFLCPGHAVLGFPWNQSEHSRLFRCTFSSESSSFHLAKSFLKRLSEILSISTVLINSACSL